MQAGGIKNLDTIAMVRSSITLIFLFFLSLAEAQVVRHIVYLQDKNKSSYSFTEPQKYLSARSVARRTKQSIAIDSTDLPVSETYISGIKGEGAKVIFPFKWLNAVLIEADTSVITDIQQLSYVKSIISYSTSLPPYPTARKALVQASSTGRVSVTDPYYGNAYNQINMLGINDMHQAGYHGEGMIVGIFDDGFSGAQTHHAFDSLFSNNRVKATYDIAAGGTDVYNDGSHGTSVLSCVAACDPGKMVSGAYKASYYLFRTEVDVEETPLELFYWLKAAELADSIGIDVVSSSLGYNTFDNAAYSYTYANMDGKTTVAAEAANWCFQKGMIVTNSAGNEGTTVWKYIISPADAPGALTVGAVDANGQYASFSSVGPSADKRIKPDLAAQGVQAAVAASDGSYTTLDGTSFAAPNVCGLVVGFWQAFPGFSNAEIVKILKKSASHANNPDNLSGYGIPRFDSAKNMALGLTDTNLSGEPFTIFPNPVTNENLFIRVGPSKRGSDVTVDIYDIQSKFITRKILNNIGDKDEIVLNCSILSNGVYVLKVIDQLNTVNTYKLVKH